MPKRTANHSKERTTRTRTLCSLSEKEREKNRTTSNSAKRTLHTRSWRSLSEKERKKEKRKEKQRDASLFIATVM